MAYIGQSIKNGTFTVLDTSGNTYNGSNTAFNLGTQVGSPAQLLVSHDGVIQKPGTDYTLSSGGAAITFTTAPASGASIFIVEISGAVGGPMNTDINGAEFILDVDGDTSITADTDDQIDFKTAGSDVVTIDSSGDVGIGDTSPDAPLHVHRAGSNGAVTEMVRLSTAAQNDGSGIKVDFRTAHTNGILEFVDGSGSFDGAFVFKTANGSALATPAERMRIDGSGNINLSSNILDIDASTNSATGVGIGSNGVIHCATADGVTNYVAQKISGSGTETAFFCMYGSSGVGSIQYTSSSTSFNTSSDYRLKENVDYTFDATSRLKQLKPARFNFKVDADTTVDGFLAHEVSNIVPEAVSGEKDAVDSNGDMISQQIDQSKLVPLLVKTIQELEARITALEG